MARGASAPASRTRRRAPRIPSSPCSRARPAVTLVTALIYGLERWVPVLSLTVLYILAVLPVAVAWGLFYAVAVSVASMLAFNFFFLAPVHTLTLAETRDWFALLVFVVTAIVVSELATRSRRRAREGSLLTEIATSLLEHGTLGAELERISEEAARALQVERARIVLGSEPDGGVELTAGGRRVGSILLEGGRGGRVTRTPAAGCSRRSPRCSASRSTASGSRGRRSRPRRYGAPT